MLGALIIVFREVIEAGLIVGITMAVTRGIAGRGYYIGAGVVAGVLGACLVGAFINTISGAFQGVGQELFNASILGIAVVMLTWHNVWMARHGREIAIEMRRAGEAVRTGASTLAGLASCPDTGPLHLRCHERAARLARRGACLAGRRLP
jgi:high-affinity iron transporter